MQLSGRHTVTSIPATLWTMLMDTETLARIIPGVSRLEKTGDNTFKSFIDINLGPVNASFTGEVQLEDINEPNGFTLKIKQSSGIGNANAAIKIVLSGIDEGQSEINFNGDVKLTGLLASMGQRILTAVANTLTKQFFKNLDKEIHAPVSK